MSWWTYVVGNVVIDNVTFINFDEKATYIIPVKTVRIHYLERTKSDMLRHATLDE